MPVHFPNSGPHAGGFLRGLLEDRLQERNPQEYAAVFRARMAEIPSADERPPSWRAGWNVLIGCSVNSFSAHCVPYHA